MTSVASTHVSRSSHLFPQTCLQPSTFVSSRGTHHESYSDDESFSSVGVRSALPFRIGDVSPNLFEIISEKLEALSARLQSIELDLKPLHGAVHRIEDDMKPLQEAMKSDEAKNLAVVDLQPLSDSMSRVETVGTDALNTSKAILEALMALKKAPDRSNRPFTSWGDSLPPEGTFREPPDVMEMRSLPGWENTDAVDPKDITCGVATEDPAPRLTHQSSGPFDIMAVAARLSKQDEEDDEKGFGERQSGLQRLAEEEETTELAEVVRAMMVKQEMHDMEGSPSEKKIIRALLQRLFTVALWWDRIVEPERSGILYKILNSSMFETLSMCTIITNCGFVAFGADWAMRNLGEDPPFFNGAMELGFVVFYLLELMLKLTVHRLYFFVNADMKWNWLDFVLVATSSVDIFIFWLVHGGRDEASGDNVVFIRILRILKLAKIFRAFRAMRFVKELVVIMESLTQSMIALFWVFVMLTFMLCVFALVILQGMVEYLSENEALLTVLDKDVIKEHFGSMPQSMLTLYMSVTGGDDWGKYYRIVASAGFFYAGIYLFFTFFFTFALFNMLTGIFVEKTVTASTPDRADMALHERRKARRDAGEFKHVCRILDKNGRGVVTWRDFQKYMHDETMASYMGSIGLEIHDVEMFFNMVAGSASNGEVPIDRFVNGCMVLKGAATAIDMQQQLFEMHSLTKRFTHFEEVCHQQLQDIRYSLNRGNFGKSDELSTSV